MIVCFHAGVVAEELVVLAYPITCLIGILPTILHIGRDAEERVDCAGALSTYFQPVTLTVGV